MRLRYFRGNIFVGNLPSDLSEDQLAELFDPHGMVLSASIAHDPQTGKRLRYGFVDIATEQAANRAVAALNGTKVEGHAIDVRISERTIAPKPDAAAPRPAPAKRLELTLRAARVAFPSAPAPKQPQFQVERRPLPRRDRAAGLTR